MEVTEDVTEDVTGHVVLYCPSVQMFYHHQQAGAALRYDIRGGLGKCNRDSRRGRVDGDYCRGHRTGRTPEASEISHCSLLP